MTRFNHTAGFDNEHWQWMQAMSGLMNPAAYAREIVANAKREHEIRMAITNLTKEESPLGEYTVNGASEPPPEVLVSPIPDVPVSIRREEFDRRWEALDCDDEFDEKLMLARDSFIKEQGIRLGAYATRDEMEDKALRYLENAVAKRGMTNPRGWLVDRYKKLQNKKPTRTYAR